MLDKPEKDKKRKRFRVIITCALLGVALGVWFNRTSAQGQSDGVTGVVRTITMPVANALSGVGRWTNEQIGGLFRWRSLDAENRRLKEEVGRLQEENDQLKESEATVARLRKQMGFAIKDPLKKLAADVISLRPRSSLDTLVINRGSADGVKINSVVVAPDGLVGYVFSVAPTSSTVLLLTDRNASVGAMVQREDSRATGVCRGNDSELLSLLYVNPTLDIQKGDTIISSGLGQESGIFPKGIVIGKVVVVNKDISGASKTVTVHPSVDFGRLEEVYVLK